MPLARVKLLLGRPAQLSQKIALRARAVAGLLRVGLKPPAKTSLNQPVGPQRHFDWLSLDLAEVKRVKARLGGTLNDVILATISGALRRFLGVDRAGVHGSDYRVVVPVSVRAAAAAGRTDNRVSAWLTSLPLDESDPVARLR